MRLQAEQKIPTSCRSYIEQPRCLCVTDCSNPPQWMNEGAFTPAVFGAFEWKTEANGSKLQAACCQNPTQTLDRISL